MTDVLIVAPTLALRAGLRALLDTGGVQVAGEIPSFAHALDWAAFDVLLLADHSLLAEAAPLIQNDGRASALVLIDDRSEQALPLLRSLPLRGWAVLGQEAGAAELAAAVQAAAQGMVALPLALAQRVETRPLADPLASHAAETLTSREREVLDLLAQGLSNKLIARALTISEHTVKFHISSIYSKLGAANRTEAVNRGARLGLIAL